MLWNVVYEFFVKYIFGGIIDGNLYDAGLYYYLDFDDVTEYFSSGESYIKLGDSFFLPNGSNCYMPIGNYLSFIATIISMVAIVLICCHFIKKVYNIFAHVIG